MSVNVPVVEFAPQAYVTVCDECGKPVTMFTLNEQARASCVPCGHPAHVSIVPNPNTSDDAAA